MVAGIPTFTGQIMLLSLPVPMILSRFCADYLGRTLRLIALTVLACGATAARAEWREATSEHFVVVSGGSERELVRLSQRLEAVHWMMTLLTGVQPQGTAQKVRIYLVDDISDVHEAMGVAPGSSVAGFYRPDLTGAIAVVPRSEGSFSTTILFHEYAHHFMLQYLEAAYPGWFVEGFAEFVSTASFEREGAITIGKVANHRAYEIEAMQWVPVPRMFAPRSAEDREAGVATYGQYWVAAHYLLLDNNRRMQLNRFMNAVNRGVAIEEAYALFDGGLDQLDRDMRVYSRRQTFPGRLATLPPDVMANPVVRILRPGETAAIPLELQVSRNLNDEDKTDLATRVSALVAQYPDDPVVLALQARFLFEKGDWAAAETAAARAFALDPANFRARAWQGWSIIKRLHDQGEDMSMTRISPARAMIVEAQRMAPSDPVALVAFYDSFVLAGREPLPSAYAAIVEAARQAPQVDEIRMTAAMAMIEERQLAQAARLLAPLAYAPHRSSQQGYALVLLQWVRNGAEGSLPVYIEVPTVELEVAD